MIWTQDSVIFHSLDCGTLPAAVSVSRFHGKSGVQESHLMVCPTEYADFATQLEWVFSAYQSALSSTGLDRGTCVLRRFFCSDLTNQAAALETHPFADPHCAEDPCAVSRVCQPPAPPAKVALWAYHVSDPGGAPDKSKDDLSLSLRRGELTHIWTTGVTCTDDDTSYAQTKGIFDRYNDYLRARRLSLEDHVIRTWFFVENMDANYQELVAARREIFAEHGLTSDTHYIASTGIEGASADIAAKVTMDAYAISGVRNNQVQYLSAPDHLSPAHVYGVTFERGVSVTYRDRKHVIISGTASVDNAGAIVHPGHVLRQLYRTLENVEALLQQAGATLRDVCMFIVYVREPSDLDIAQWVMRERFGAAPAQVVLASVCRPGWLVEVECVAIVPACNPGLPAF